MPGTGLTHRTMGRATCAVCAACSSGPGYLFAMTCAQHLIVENTRQGSVLSPRPNLPAHRAVLASLAALLLVVCGPARGSRPEIEQLLRDIQVAVLAGDHEAYLRLVDNTDPVFFQEQRMWAEDLKKIVPTDFRLVIREASGAAENDSPEEAGDKESGGSSESATGGHDPVKIGDGTAEAPIEMVWTLPKAEKPRTLRWTAKFRRGDQGWLYAGEKWNKLESEGVLVLFDDGLEGAAKAVAEALPPVRKHVEQGFEFGPDSPLATRVQQVKIYGSMQHLQASIYLSYTDGIAGWNEPGEAIKLLVGRRTTADSLKPLLAHEYGHVATFELGTARMPWWILEGVAELSAEAYGKSREQNDKTVRHWKATGKLPPFEEMAEFDDRAKKWYGQVYGQGHHMLGYISDRFGSPKRVAWLRAQAQGASLDDATMNVLGLSFADLDKQWRDSIPDEEKAPQQGT